MKWHGCDLIEEESEAEGQDNMHCWSITIWMGSEYLLIIFSDKRVMRGHNLFHMNASGYQQHLRASHSKQGETVPVSVTAT
jgi:hypothetical protein